MAERNSLSERDTDRQTDRQRQIVLITAPVSHKEILFMCGNTLP